MQVPTPPKTVPNTQEVRDRLVAEHDAGKRVPYMLLVSGFARSGTSLMMQILDASGVTCHKHEAMNTGSKDMRLTRDQDYNPHPGGIYENMPQNWVTLQYGDATKIFIPDWDKSLFQIKAATPEAWKMIFMTRDYEELKMSCKKMYRYKWAYFCPKTEWEFHAKIKFQVGEEWRITPVHYNELMEHPRRELQKLVDRKWPIDVDAGCSIIDPLKWYRHRA